MGRVLVLNLGLILGTINSAKSDSLAQAKSKTLNTKQGESTIEEIKEI